MIIIQGPFDFPKSIHNTYFLKLGNLQVSSKYFFYLKKSFILFRIKFLHNFNTLRI